MSKTRIAVAGAGYIGQAHMGVAQKSPSCTLSAIVDPASAAVGIAARAGVPLFASLAELFARDRPEGVILATPNQLPVPHAMACIEAGLPMWLEKPIAPTLRQFDVVFNATSASLRAELPPVPATVFAEGCLAYELAYGKGLTPFLRLAQNAGVRRLADGVGMLAEQAAEAFAWWRGVRPDTRAVIDKLTVPLA